MTGDLACRETNWERHNNQPYIMIKGNHQVKTRIITVFLFVVGLLICTGCDSSKFKTSSDKSAENLTIGISEPRYLSSLIWISEDQGYFAKHGLKVSVQFCESGVAAAKDLLAGKLDLATVTEFVAARCILEQNAIRIITSLCESDDVKLVARKDRGITQLSDIRHKRIGVLRGGGGEFFLDLLIALQNIPSKDIQKVDLSPSDQVRALSKGDVDAAVMWEPFVSEVTNNLGPNMMRWSAQNGQNYYWLLLGMEETIKKRPHMVSRFVSSLISAEEFFRNNKDEARMIIARKLGSDNPAFFQEKLFEVGLDHPLVLAMEAQIRWMNPSLLTHHSKLPDLISFVYFDALNSVQPERIRLLH